MTGPSFPIGRAAQLSLFRDHKFLCCMWLAVSDRHSDLIINLLSLGMGISFVPIRSLAPSNQRQKFARLKVPSRFTRELVMVARKHRSGQMVLEGL